MLATDGLKHTRALFATQRMRVQSRLKGAVWSARRQFSEYLTRSAAQPRDPALVAREFMAGLLESGPGGRQSWEAFHHELSTNYDDFAAQLGTQLSPTDRLHLSELFLIAIARNSFKTFESKNLLFDRAQAFGVHVLPVHFYNPVPNTSELNSADFEQYDEFLAHCRISADEQLQLLRKLSVWATELADIPADDDGSGFFWNNPAFGPMDGIVYYAIMREFKPALVLEVGSGFSTMLAMRAAVRNGSTRVRCIEPYPMTGLRESVEGAGELIERRVQDVALREFDALEAGDILFIDSTHVSKMGSDVNYLVLRVLPRLKPGVLVHIHDMCIPYEYPQEWVLEKKIFWNEQYMVMAMLLFGNTFDILLMHHFLEHDQRAELEAIFPAVPSVGGGSIWLRKRDGAAQ
jgi:Methyltransferase domain